MYFIFSILLIILGAIVILDFSSMPLFFYWIKTGETRKAKCLILFKPFITLICIFFMFAAFGGGLFLGAVYQYLSFNIMVLLFIVYLAMAFFFRKGLGFPNKRYLFNLLIGFCLVMSVIIPSKTYLPIKESCSIANSKKILPISEAMQKYFDDHGKYPKSIDELVPSYLPTLPKPVCSFFLPGLRFDVRVCGNDKPTFFTPTIDGVGYDLYAFGDGSHFRIHSFLDYPDPGHCP